MVSPGMNFSGAGRTNEATSSSSTTAESMKEDFGSELPDYFLIILNWLAAHYLDLTIARWYYFNCATLLSVPRRVNGV
jgi:hypothetical protein